MDFHGFTRKKLQALCNKNKILANLTNVVMAVVLGGLVAVSILAIFGLSCLKVLTTITQAYSTRRSARLAKKKGMMLNEEGHETFGLVQMDLIAKYDPNMNTCLKESREDLDEISGITVSQEVNISEAEIAIVSTKEITNPDDHVAVKDNAFDLLENVVLESGDNAEIGGVLNEKGINIVEEMDSGDVTDFYANTEIVQTNAEVHIDMVEKELNLVEPSEGSHHSTCDPLVGDLIQEEAPTERRNKINLAQIAELELQQTSNEVLGTKLDTDSTPSGENHQHQKAGTEVESTVVTPLKNSVGGVLVEGRSPHFAPKETNQKLDKECSSNFAPRHQFFKPGRSMPTRDSTSKKMSSVISDNKENIGSGSKLILAKEKPKMAKSSNAENVLGVSGFSNRQLTEMLKNKLEMRKNENENNETKVVILPGLSAFSKRQLTKMVKYKLEMSKNENENNKTKAQTPARPVLQELLENR